MSNEPKKKSTLAEKWFGAGIALGVMFGIIFDNISLWLPIGIIFDNISLWLPIGVCIGLVVPALKKRMNKDKNSEQDNG